MSDVREGIEAVSAAARGKRTAYCGRSEQRPQRAAILKWRSNMYGNTVVRRWLPVAALTALVGWPFLSLAQDKKADAPKPKEKDIVAVAKENASLKTFSKLLDTAGLADTLKGKGPYTVFAPSDDAFKKLGKEVDEWQKPENKAKLQRILKHHVLEGKKTGADVKAMKSIKTMAGEEIKVTVEGEVVMLGTAKVTKTDTDGGNGLIHMIDAVLMPAPEKDKPAHP